MNRILPLIPLAALAACATPLPPAIDPGPPVAFEAEAFAWSTAAGTNSISGTVSYLSPAGNAWTCAGGSVGLTPETAYSRQRVATLYGSTTRARLPAREVRSRTVADAGSDYRQFVRTASCDALGRFSFSGLPDGAWYVISQARPPATGTPEDALAVMQRVEVRGGQALTVALN